MKLLVVEDENKTADYVRQGLMEAGFVVDLARNGLDGHHLAMGETYDLVVLDVMLPDVDGWRIVRALRDAGKQVPVLFLTARGGVDDRVKGLELGADDYLVKPFAFSELLARVRTLLRRGSAPSQPDRIQVADLVLDLARRRATRAGQRINLTSKEFALLELLARRQGGGPSTVSDRVAGMGHEFRQRQQRHRCSHPPSTREDRRCVQSEAHPHRAWNGIHARCAR